VAEPIVGEMLPASNKVPLAEVIVAEPGDPLTELAVLPMPAEPAHSPDLPPICLMPTPSRRLVESLVIFLGAIVFLRAIMVEPFGVPTGSMSPTLIGNHRCAICPRCGYPIRIGDPGKPLQKVALRKLGDEEFGTVIAVPVKVDDPIKKDQELFTIATARSTFPITSPADGFVAELRVEVGSQVAVNTVVAIIGFTVDCPNCGHSTRAFSSPYDNADDEPNAPMKMSGDRLLVDKNVYSLRSPRRWEPAVFRCPSDLTKPYVKRVVGLPGEQIQVFDGDVYINGRLTRKTLGECRETCIPIFDMNFVPKDDGWAKRWSVDRQPAEAGAPHNEAALNLSGAELRLDGASSTHHPVWAVYTHHRYDDATHMEVEEVIRDGFVYNGDSAERGWKPETRPSAVAVHDLLLSFEVVILSGSGSLQCRMTDGQDVVIAGCPAGATQAEAELRHEGKFDVVRGGKRKPLEAGKKYRVEMAFVDRRVSFAIDGAEPFAAYDLNSCTDRKELIAPLAIGAQGINIAVRDLKISRDIFYRSSGRNGVDSPVQLGADEYFMLGDNSANSEDSRAWYLLERPNWSGGVPERNFLGKPFLLHQPSGITHFSVVGQEYVFRWMDWSRARFLR
jgi:signal peptidase I